MADKIHRRALLQTARNVPLLALLLAALVAITFQVLVQFGLVVVVLSTVNVLGCTAWAVYVTYRRNLGELEEAEEERQHASDLDSLNRRAS